MLRPLNDTDPRVMGPYRLHNRIGAGGMGVVYLGFGPDDQPVAVKVPHEVHASDPEFRARFRSEVSAARHVRADTVARVIRAEVDGPKPWLATEYVAGPTLRAAVQEGGPLTGRPLDGLAIGLAAALEAIHAASVVHRDLKPANIVMSWAGPKVIDFGVARSADYTGYTQAGELVGTVVWMAPEQINGQQAGSAADVFAWGCCVVFAATGRRPFRGEAPEIVALHISSTEPELDGVPERLLGPVRQALTKNPGHRPSAGELVRLLTQRLSPEETADASNDVPPVTGAEPNREQTRPTPNPGPPATPPPTPSPVPTPSFPAVGPAHPSRPSPSSSRPSVLTALLALTGLAATVGVWAAETERTGHAVVGPVAAAIIGLICGQMIFLSDRRIGVLTTVAAAVSGSGIGLLLARVLDVDEPNRVLLSVAGALIVATAFAGAMAPSRPAPGDRPGTDGPGEPVGSHRLLEPTHPVSRTNTGGEAGTDAAGATLRLHGAAAPGQHLVPERPDPS
ncbi:serine/threonine protein kinase [Frankia casuarinae]|uniref:Serine/threonine protein kinase n=1 Tax=Frankia casuarinae (strain DSM 45818 / CECT 9043 / HFP020203 / CcI3) TaxID=106370 RepID=Q2JG45_FRACC|nr:MULTISPECIES: serine/threonine-protein kinase [Frankia]ABD09747.1 serine/threonine protein kinase [Frankia casuarinae]ETA02271.1 serine/threonine protein kinase [Frankia sp. CcI6]EYT92990.1 serine/threonine protein kinase [Frankia casuarinae]KDA43305.1 serine/threonine protein kinase [Frankia sp. BMG5.23]KEZ36731.1 serine/threonine protein kinase [Frankia sp. CeD]